MLTQVEAEKRTAEICELTSQIKFRIAGFTPSSDAFGVGWQYNTSPETPYGQRYYYHPRWTRGVIEKTSGIASVEKEMTESDFELLTRAARNVLGLSE